MHWRPCLEEDWVAKTIVKAVLQDRSGSNAASLLNLGFPTPVSLCILRAHPCGDKGWKDLVLLAYLQGLVRVPGIAPPIRLQLSS